MINFNQVFSKYILLFATIFAIIALIFVEINVNHISYKYIDGSVKPKINFYILDSKLFDSKTYTDLFSDSESSEDINNSSQTNIDSGLIELISTSNINEVIDAISLKDSDDDKNQSTDDRKIVSSNTAGLPTVSSIQIAILKAKIKMLENNFSNNAVEGVITKSDSQNKGLN